MIKKSHRNFIVLSIFILLTLIIILTLVFGSDRVNDRTLVKYADTFRNNYNTLIYKLIPEDKRVNFLIKEDSNYGILISKETGASVDFSDSVKSKYVSIVTDEKINVAKAHMMGIEITDYGRQYIEKNYNNSNYANVINGNFGSNYYSYSTLVLPSCFNCKINNLQIVWGALDITGKNTFITNTLLDTSYFILRKDTSLFALNTSIVNEVTGIQKTADFIIVKDSNKKSDWTVSNAINESSSFFWSIFPNVFVNSKEFKEYLAEPNLSSIAEEILEKQTSGVYDNNPLIFIRDFEYFHFTASHYNVTLDFADEVYNAIEKQKNRQDDKHKEWRQLILGTILGVIFDRVLMFVDNFVKNHKKQKKKKKGLDEKRNKLIRFT